MTTIEWTRGDDGSAGETWNPTTGCDRVSPGCDHCYALTLAARLKRMGQAKYQNDGDPRTSGPGFALTVHPDALDLPLRWRKPRKVFVNSMSDLFHKDVPEAFVSRVFDAMGEADYHTYQVLTKRPQRMSSFALARQRRASEYAAKFDDCPTEAMRNSPAALDARARAARPPAHIWLGTSIESDRYAWRADHLRATPAAVRFLSCEPLLGPLPSLDLTGIDWVIIGAESGPGARSMANEWAVDLVEQCRAAGVAAFVKQLSGGVHAVKDVDLFPEPLRIRQYPTPTVTP